MIICAPLPDLRTFMIKQKKENLQPSDITEGVRTIVKKFNLSSSVTVKTPGAYSSQAYILSELVAQNLPQEAPILVLCKDAIEKLRLWEIAKFYLEIKDKKNNSQSKTKFFAEISPEFLNLIKNKKNQILLIAYQDEVEKMPDPESFYSLYVSIKKGEKIKKKKLLENLVKAGYKIERSASMEGLVAQRGSIVDIFPRGQKNILRVDFNDTTIDSIKTIEPGASKGIEQTKAIIIPNSIEDLPKISSIKKWNNKIKNLYFDPFPAKYDCAISFSEKDIKNLNEIISEKPNKNDINSSFIKNLKTGDYIVHLDHGVARFLGIVEHEIGGIKGEYFSLSYAEGDKLFLPVTSAEKIEKYIGETNPTLNRLGNGSWSKTIWSAKMETLSEARELLNIQAYRKLAKVLKIERSDKIEKSLGDSFTFQETEDQKNAIEKVYQDLSGITPMDRLICGDVGFGKTEVAVRAAGKAALEGYQVAILAPTTILSQQHLDTIRERLKEYPIIIESLSRFQSAKKQKENIEKLAKGKIDIIIGTHRLISEDVKFSNLGLIIIDEEQRFGVKHKEALKKMRSSAHVLTLTATPIPRTLHLAYSGVRDISVIGTPPSGRKPIETFIEPYDHNRIVNSIKTEIERKGQVYYLFNNVESMSLKKQELSKLLSEIKIGILHGQLPENEIAKVMHDFDTKKIDVLVCSTIIENGLDLPNVNTLIVDNSTQFGLSQLHQIRGRIGRGKRQAYAYFFYKRQKLTGEAERRLSALEEARKLGSGFDIAVKDMEIRGVGNVLGKAQHGHVKSIGLGLYLRLLENAVEEIKTGGAKDIIPDVSVDLPIEARIPAFFEPDKEKRIEKYHEWALIENIEKLSEIKKTIEKDGSLPAALENLFYVLRIKLLAKKAGISAIDTIGAFPGSEQTIVLKPKETIEPKRFGKILNISQGWEYSTEEIRIKKSSLGSDWKKMLEKNLLALA